MSDDLKPISTSDTPFAAFLRYHQHQIIGVVQDKNDIKRKVFVFAARDDSEDLRQEFYEGQPMVDPKYYYKLIREMFTLLRTQ